MSRVAVVTGAAGGVGSAVSRRLRGAGWLVAGVDRAPAPDADLSLPFDVSDHREFAAAVVSVERELGPVDALVSAAGHYESIPFAQVTDDQAERMLRVHLGGFFAGSRAVLPAMLERGTGAIVAIASELAVGGGARDSHYAAAKGAVLGAAKSLAAEVAPAGIRVNAVAPGPIDTPMLPPDSPWRDTAYLSTLPARALAHPDEVALCVHYLLDSADFVTGETLHPNSGAVI